MNTKLIRKEGTDTWCTLNCLERKTQTLVGQQVILTVNLRSLVLSSISQENDSGSWYSLLQLTKRKIHVLGAFYKTLRGRHRSMLHSTIPCKEDKGTCDTIHYLAFYITFKWNFGHSTLPLETDTGPLCTLHYLERRIKVLHALYRPREEHTGLWCSLHYLSRKTQVRVALYTT